MNDKIVIGFNNMGEYVLTLPLYFTLVLVSIVAGTIIGLMILYIYYNQFGDFPV